MCIRDRIRVGFSGVNGKGAINEIRLFDVGGRAVRVDDETSDMVAEWANKIIAGRYGKYHHGPGGYGRIVLSKESALRKWFGAVTVRTNSGQPAEMDKTNLPASTMEDLLFMEPDGANDHQMVRYPDQNPQKQGQVNSQ